MYSFTNLEPVWCSMSSSNCYFLTWIQSSQEKYLTQSIKKGSVSFHSKRRMSKYHTFALISHASKVMLKILQARDQHYVNWEFPDVQTRSSKGRGTRDQIANIPWIIEKAREFQKKTSISALLTVQNFWLCGSQKMVESSSRYGNTRPRYLPPGKSVCRSRSNI